ncbi:MAG: hypothetical protein JNM07_08715 [Phycisphaerae bacterium]|nr:hypothetical protein [Phycisphaerae bacterium]
MHIHPVGGHRTWRAVLADIAADYADWRLDPRTITVETAGGDSTDMVARLFRAAMGEAFRIR